MISTNVFATTIGDVLLVPDSTWKRYDDNSKEITYVGNQWSSHNHAAYYGGSRHYSFNTNLSDKVVFKFNGTKIRIISSSYPTYSSDLYISIDGVKEKFSQAITEERNQVLVYEMNGLSAGIHSVEIGKNAKGIYSTDLTIDAIDIDEEGMLLSYDYTNLIAKANSSDSSIALSWNTVENASSYIVKRSTTQGQGYSIIKEGITETSYIDNTVESNTMYYYVVEPIIAGQKGTTSNEVSAMIEETVNPPVEETGNATLIITMTNGNVKQYNVDMTLVNNFISWYTNRSAGSSGLPYFSIDKKENLAPYTKKTEYLIFDKMSSFEIGEYAQ